MIDYRTGCCGFGFLFRLRGSVFPRAMVFAVPSAGFTFAVGYFFEDIHHLDSFDLSGFSAIWSGFTFVLGFLLVFRTQQAYARYWEGATLIRQCRGEWFNATSSVIAFCTLDLERKAEVEEFQHLLIRLMSMLHCVGLQSIADMEDDHFDFIDITGVDEASQCFLASLPDKNQRCEVIIQWVQQLVVRNMASGLLPIPAPVMTRFFQELSRGAVYVTQARNMTDIPFPFPYAQMLTVMLIIYWLLTPVVNCIILEPPWSCLFTFVSVLAFWGTSLIAAEIECPFGDDPNDLPIAEMQDDMNASLWLLLERQTQKPPRFTFEKQHRLWLTRCETISKVNGQGVVQREGPRKSLAGRSSHNMQTIDSVTSTVVSVVSAGSHRRGRKRPGRYSERRQDVGIPVFKELSCTEGGQEDYAEGSPSSASPSRRDSYMSCISECRGEHPHQTQPVMQPVASPEMSVPSGFVAPRQAAGHLPPQQPDVQASLGAPEAAGRPQPREPKLSADLLSSCALDISPTRRRQLDQQLTRLGGCMEEYISQIFADVVQRRMLAEQKGAGLEALELVAGAPSSTHGEAPSSTHPSERSSHWRATSSARATALGRGAPSAPCHREEPAATPRLTPRQDSQGKRCTS